MSNSRGKYSSRRLVSDPRPLPDHVWYITNYRVRRFRRSSPNAPCGRGASSGTLEKMAAFAKMRRFGAHRRPWALCVAVLFALATISFSVASLAAAPWPDAAGVHCPTSSDSAPQKHPCEGAQCCPLCGQSEKETLAPCLASAPGSAAYAPPRRAASRAAIASPAPAGEYARLRSIAIPRAPPRFS